MTVDLKQLEDDLRTLGAPVKLGDVVTDWNALIRVVNAAHDLLAIAKEKA